jgi:hypothetical protein
LQGAREAGWAIDICFILEDPTHGQRQHATTPAQAA